MPVLELTGVEKHFGGLPAVDGVDLRIEDEEIVALVGPNGAGKSTLLKAINGLQPPTRGSVRLAGVELVGLKTHVVRQRGVAMVLQHPQVFESMTVRENAIVGGLFGVGGERPSAATAAQRADDALTFTGLIDRAEVDVGALTLHEKRTVEFARALAGQPKLLLLDEVMAGLNDTELAASIEMIRAARNELGITIIWVEHVMNAVMSLAERVVVLHFGRTIADGVPADVMAEDDVIAAYLGTGGDR